MAPLPLPRRRYRGPLAAVLVAAAAVVVPHPTAASVADALALADLVARADDVVVGDCVREDAHFDPRGRIVTDVRLRVVDIAKGGAHAGDEIVVRTLGGVVGDLGMRVPGAARIPMGSRRMLFLAPDVHERAVRRVVGMSQGAFPVEPAPAAGGVDVVLPGGAGLALVRRDARGRLVPSPGALAGPTPLPMMLDAVRDLARAGDR